VIFACANNRFTEYHPYRDTTATEHIAPRAEGYGAPWKIVDDGNDLTAVCEAMAEAIERARTGGGPTLIEFMTYRIAPHHTGDPCVYRKKEEVESWKKKINQRCKFSDESGLLTEERSKIYRRLNLRSKRRSILWRRVLS
jgi:pyruvate dehydrogenase E1 component alpha subunit